MTTAYIPGMIPEFDKADRHKKAITVSGVPVGEMAEYLGVPVTGPFKPSHYRY